MILSDIFFKNPLTDSWVFQNSRIVSDDSLEYKKPKYYDPTESTLAKKNWEQVHSKRVSSLRSLVECVESELYMSSNLEEESELQKAASSLLKSYSALENKDDDKTAQFDRNLKSLLKKHC